MDKISITHVNNAHNDWLRALDFYKQEISILKKRLTEIGGKNTGAEVLKEVEQYENKFKVQIDNIDRLNHDIRQNISNVENQLKEGNAGYIDKVLVAQHNNLHERYNTEENTINDIRRNFNIFAASWM